MENPKIISLFERIVGLKTFLSQTFKKLQSVRNLDKDVNQSLQAKSKSENSNKSVKQEEKEKKSTYSRFINFLLSLIFLIFTIMSLGTQLLQNKSFFTRIPLVTKLSASNVILDNEHGSILEDLLVRYNSIFDFYRNKLNNKTTVVDDYDLIPIGTFRVSISRTGSTDCEKAYLRYVENHTCYETLYNPLISVNESKLIETAFDNKNLTDKMYNVIDYLNNGIVRQINAWNFLTALYDSILLQPDKPALDKVCFKLRIKLKMINSDIYLFLNLHKNKTNIL